MFRLRAGQQKFRVRYLKGKIFFSLKGPDRLWGTTSSLLNGIAAHLLISM